MANSIEQRIVQLGLDNLGFQKNAEQSIQTLDRLDNSLNSFGQGSSLQNIENMLGQITHRFSAMGIAGDQVIRNLTNKAMQLVGQLGRVANSMSIDQITVGWGKYGEKTAAVQTIMAATAKDWEDTGAQMAYVNEQLARLNWFTDETSYSFLDMVNNIGKFTSNGVKLDDAVTSMEGISVWAAISGAGINEAGRAMYNLSQAMAVGSVKLMDWRSIENANMSTREFKETALETAVALGKLTKSVDKTGKAMYKTAKNHEFTAEQFNTYLSDEWFSKDVLQATLNKYGEFAGVLGQVSEATGMTASEILGEVEAFKNSTNAVEAKKKVSKELLPYIEKLASDEYDLGYRAFLAAQEAKTLKEAIDSVKDAVSTGWMNIFEYIFGDYEEAKKLWTDLAESLYNIFAEPVNSLQEIVRAAFTDNSGWSRFKKDLDDLGFSLEGFEKAYRDIMGISGKDWKSMLKEYGSMQGMFESGAIGAETFRKVLQKMAKDTTDLSWEDTDKLAEAMEKYKLAAQNYSTKKMSDDELTNLGYDADLVHLIAKQMNAGVTDSEKLVKYIKSVKPDALENLAKAAGLSKEQTEALNAMLQNTDDVLDDITEHKEKAFTGRKIFTEGFMNIFHAIENVAGIFGEAFHEVFGDTDELADKLYAALERFKAFTEKLQLSEDAAAGLKIIFTDILTVFQKIGQLIGKVLGLGGKGVGGIWDAIINFLERVGRGEQITLLGFLFEKLGGIFNWVTGLFEKNASIWSTIGGWITSALEKIGEAFTYIKTAVKTAFDGEGLGIDLFKVLGAGLGGLFAFKTGKGIFDTLSGIFKVLKSPADLIDSVSESLDSLAEALQSFSKKTDTTAADIRSIAISLGIMAIALAVLASIDADQLGHAITALVAIAGVMALMIGVMQNISVATRTAKGLTGTLNNAISQFMEVQKIKAIGTAMLMIAGAMLVLSFAVRSFAKLSWEDLGKGLGALAFTLLMVSLSIGYLTDVVKKKNLGQVGAAMIGISVAMLILSAAVRVLGGMNFLGLVQGVLALGAVMLIMTVSLESLAKIASGKKLLAAGAAMMMVATAMIVLAAAVAIFSYIPIDNLIQGIGAMMILLFGVVAAIGALGAFDMNIGGMLAGAAAMLLVAAAMIGMSVAVGILSAAMNNNESALFGMIALIITMTIALAALGAIGPVVLAAGAGMALLGIGLIGASVGFLLLAKGLKVLEGVKVDAGQLLKIALCLVPLGLGGAILAIGAPGLLLGGAGLLVLAAALRVMTGTDVAADYLLSLGGALMAIGLAGIVFGLGGPGLLLGGVGLLVLASALQVFNGVTVNADYLMRIADAITLLGFGGIAFGIGGLGLLLGVGGWALGIPVLEQLSEIMPKLAAGFSAFGAVDWSDIGTAIGALTTAIASLFLLQFATILNGIPVLNQLSESMPNLANGFKCFEDIDGELIKGVGDAMASAIKSLFRLQFSTIIDGTVGLNSLSEALPKLAVAFHAFDGFEPERITELTTALSNGINLLLGNAFTNLFKGGIDFHTVAVGISEIATAILTIPDDAEERLRSIESVNSSLIVLQEAPWNTVAKGFKKLGDAVGTLTGNGLEAAVTGVTSLTSDIEELNTILGTIPEVVGVNMEGFYQAIVEWSPQIVNVMRLMAMRIVNFLSSMWRTWYLMGSYVALGFAQGMSDYSGYASNAASNMAYSVQETMSEAFDMHSPSKLTERMGGFIDAGLAKGIQNGSSEVESSMYTVVDPLLSILAAMMSEDFDISPTITPVIDMTNADAAVGYLSDSLSQSYRGSARIDAAIAQRTNEVNRVAASMDREPVIGGGDNVTFNIYPSPGMDENKLADAVMTRMASRLDRRKAALGR